MTLSYVLTVEPIPDGAPMSPEDVAQYIRLRLESQNVIQVTAITGIKDNQDE
jgi:hypothetical protein